MSLHFIFLYTNENLEQNMLNFSEINVWAKIVGNNFFIYIFFACLCNSQLHWMSSGTLRSHHAVINPIWSCGVFSVCSRALLKQRVLVKARLGESLLLDMQRFTSEGETVCAQMWRRAALCAKDKRQRLSCYQNAITALQVKAALTSWAL